ncbi:MAG: glycosyltransferase [Nostocoides sp.]
MTSGDHGEREAMPIAAIVPALNEAARIESTVTATAGVEGVDLVVVVDDGSTDETAAVAAAAGATVLRHPRNRGKAAAMTTGADHVAAVIGAGAAAYAVLFVDADLEASAANVAALLPPIRAGEADLTIARLPPQAGAGGGHGLVVGLARAGILQLTGWRATQPLSGMRCLNQTALAAAKPFAAGWGVEAGMTIDVLRAGLAVQEVPCDLHHRVTGAGWRGQMHRGRQYLGVWRALLSRGYRGVGR